MSDDELPSQPRGSLEFIENSLMQAIVPESTESSLEEKLRASAATHGDVDAVLRSIALRQSLFFGMRTPASQKLYILLIIDSR